MKRIKDAYSKIGKYVKDGKDKNQYRTIGALLEGEDGNLSLKLDTIPTNFDGWVYFSEPAITRAKEEVSKQEEPESEIPF